MLLKIHKGKSGLTLAGFPFVYFPLLRVSVPWRFRQH
jgi:hypothetical protein